MYIFTGVDEIIENFQNSKSRTNNHKIQILKKSPISGLKINQKRKKMSARSASNF